MYSYISRNIEYPPQLRREGVEGRVYVSIIVERDGRITGPEVLRTTHPDFGAASIRMVEQLMEQGIKFEPGKIDGEPVPVKMTIPITFKL